MSKERIQELLDSKMKGQHFKFASVGHINFHKKSFQQWHHNAIESTRYDLASLTKPLTLASNFHLSPDLKKKEKLMWPLNHRASLPVGGRLSRKTWRDQILAYPLELQKVDTYSDFSALRLQLEIEKEKNQSLYDLAKLFWDKELCHWTKIKNPFDCPPTGWRKGALIQGEVHDDNAFVLKEELSHAGLFSTLRGLCQTLLNLSSQTNLFKDMENAFSTTDKTQRFVLGWDRVQNPEQSLAGLGASASTFGHLGFTGTSIWIDGEKKTGWVLLTNATQNYWFERSGLNDLRKSLGQLMWQL